MVNFYVAFIFFLNCTNEKTFSENDQSYPYFQSAEKFHKTLQMDGFRDFGFDFYRRFVCSGQSICFELSGY